MKRFDTIILILLTVSIVALCVIHIWVLATYGGKPVSEVPAWALWFFTNR